MGKYGSLAKSAAALISRKGGPLIVRRTAEGVFNPVTQSTTGATVTVATLQGVVTPGARGADYEPGTLLRAAAIRVTFALAGAALEPRAGDQVSWRGGLWTITRASVIDPAGDGAIISECEAVQ